VLTIDTEIGKALAADIKAKIDAAHTEHPTSASLGPLHRSLDAALKAVASSSGMKPEEILPAGGGNK
jgi:hypothetical protein